MRVGIIQSCFLPWRGYFDFIDDVDLFVFLDDVQFTRRDWRNRNRFKLADGTVWATVPVYHAERGLPIDEILIDYGQSWIEKFLRLLEHGYGQSPFGRLYLPKLAEILHRRYEKLSDLNVVLTRWIMDELDIRTETGMSREFNPRGEKTDRLLSILKTVGATHYISGPTARDYLDEGVFRAAGIGLSYKNYDYPDYPQRYPPFAPQVSVLDLLCNCGPNSRHYLKSARPNEIIIP